eukprot:gnl/Dysnectes_brevis/4904_a6810_236.p1 GENE.gnl/Dysnectes_brevis/4904_a6810_236~~gnl/Dysnectes_brevis/4904_a6810_236.p1  ORF type:complete len:1571 (-),score=389.86 gnl/Dysnectes_brevis/4904_a6810_236:165-4877(-)
MFVLPGVPESPAPLPRAKPHSLASLLLMYHHASVLGVSTPCAGMLGRLGGWVMRTVRGSSKLSATAVAGEKGDVSTAGSGGLSRYISRQTSTSSLRSAFTVPGHDSSVFGDVSSTPAFNSTLARILLSDLPTMMSRDESSSMMSSMSMAMIGGDSTHLPFHATLGLTMTRGISDPLHIPTPDSPLTSMNPRPLSHGSRPKHLPSLSLPPSRFHSGGITSGRGGGVPSLRSVNTGTRSADDCVTAAGGGGGVDIGVALAGLLKPASTSLLTDTDSASGLISPARKIPQELISFSLQLEEEDSGDDGDLAGEDPEMDLHDIPKFLTRNRDPSVVTSPLNRTEDFGAAMNPTSSTPGTDTASSAFSHMDWMAMQPSRDRRPTEIHLQADGDGDDGDVEESTYTDEIDQLLLDEADEPFGDRSSTSSDTGNGADPDHMLLEPSAPKNVVESLLNGVGCVQLSNSTPRHDDCPASPFARHRDSSRPATSRRVCKSPEDVRKSLQEAVMEARVLERDATSDFIGYIDQHELSDGSGSHASSSSSSPSPLLHHQQQPKQSRSTYHKDHSLNISDLDLDIADVNISTPSHDTRTESGNFGGGSRLSTSHSELDTLSPARTAIRSVQRAFRGVRHAIWHSMPYPWPTVLTELWSGDALKEESPLFLYQQHTRSNSLMTSSLIWAALFGVMSLFVMPSIYVFLSAAVFVPLGLWVRASYLTLSPKQQLINNRIRYEVLEDILYGCALTLLTFSETPMLFVHISHSFLSHELLSVLATPLQMTLRGTTIRGITQIGVATLHVILSTLLLDNNDPRMITVLFTPRVYSALSGVFYSWCDLITMQSNVIKLITLVHEQAVSGELISKIFPSRKLYWLFHRRREMAWKAMLPSSSNPSGVDQHHTHGEAGDIMVSQQDIVSPHRMPSFNITPDGEKLKSPQQPSTSATAAAVSAAVETGKSRSQLTINVKRQFDITSDRIRGQFDLSSSDTDHMSPDAPVDQHNMDMRGFVHAMLPSSYQSSVESYRGRRSSVSDGGFHRASSHTLECTETLGCEPCSDIREIIAWSTFLDSGDDLAPLTNRSVMLTSDTLSPLGSLFRAWRRGVRVATPSTSRRSSSKTTAATTTGSGSGSGSGLVSSPLGSFKLHQLVPELLSSTDREDAISTSSPQASSCSSEDMAEESAPGQTHSMLHTETASYDMLMSSTSLGEGVRTTLKGLFGPQITASNVIDPDITSSIPTSTGGVMDPPPPQLPMVASGYRSSLQASQPSFRDFSEHAWRQVQAEAEASRRRVPLYSSRFLPACPNPAQVIRIPLSVLVQADIVSFTSFTSQATTLANVSAVLNDFFSRCDHLILSTRSNNTCEVVKMGTAGDSYSVLLAPLQTGLANAVATSELAADIAQSMHRFALTTSLQFRLGSRFRLRVGVVIGESYGAYLGDRYPRFQLLGSMATKLDRVQSAANPGGTACDAGLYTLLALAGHRFQHSPRALKAQSKVKVDSPDCVAACAFIHQHYKPRRVEEAGIKLTPPLTSVVSQYRERKSTVSEPQQLTLNVDGGLGFAWIYEGRSGGSLTAEMFNRLINSPGH